MTIQAVIFDLAGVVLHPIHGTYAGMMAERLGVSEADILPLLTSPENDMWDKGEINDDNFFMFILTELILPLNLKSVMEKFVVDDFFVDQEMLAFIRTLKKSFKTALLTNFPAHVHAFMQTAWRVDGAFNEIIVSCDVKLIKPNPKMYQLALDLLDCQPQEAVFIDDRPDNVSAAQDLGIIGILYQNRKQAIMDLKKSLITT